MNIDSIKNYPAGALIKQQHGNSLERNKEKSAGLCDNKSVNRGYYSGSFTGNVAAAAASAAAGASGKFAKETLFDKLLKLCDNHTVIAQNLWALVLATTLRPLAIMSLPGKKNKEDKTYASGHAIASGLIGFGFSSIVMYPLGQAAKKASRIAKNARYLALHPIKGTSDVLEKYKRIYGVKSIEELEHSKAFKNVTKILDMAPDVFVFGVLKAVLTVKLIKPILKYVFGLEKKPSTQEQSKKAAPEQPKEAAPAAIKPDMKKFAGGIK